jgi:hypothetical protein
MRLLSELKGVYIYVHVTTEGHLSLVQNDHRQFPKSNKYAMSRLIFMQMDREKCKPTKVIKEAMDCDYYTTFPISLTTGLYYLFIEMDWSTDFSREVAVNFYGDHPINIVEDQNVPSPESLFYELVVLDQANNPSLEVYTYPHDPNIKRVAGKFGGYVYYHYYNNSVDNKLLSEVVNLSGCKNVSVCGEDRSKQGQDQFAVKLVPGQEQLVKMKVSAGGNGEYDFRPIINNRVVEKYTPEDLTLKIKQKPTKVSTREVEN